MDLEVIEIEVYAREDRDVPREGVKYRFKVGNKLCTWDRPEITGKEILEQAGLTPVTEYQLNQKFKDGVVEPIGYEQEVDLSRKGLERFTYMKLDQTEG